MEIRDEIEKLSGLPVAGFKFPYGWINPRKWVKRKDVLSILDDKWELVGEHESEEQIRVGVASLPFRIHDVIYFEPGDHIIILRRRKDE